MSNFELFDVEDNDIMFEPPVGRGGTLKYPWYNMEPGMFFYIPLENPESHYHPPVPGRLAHEGFKVSYTKQELKETGETCMVITRIE
jgi:hypothetical protein